MRAGAMAPMPAQGATRRSARLSRRRGSHRRALSSSARRDRNRECPAAILVTPTPAGRSQKSGVGPPAHSQRRRRRPRPWPRQPMGPPGLVGISPVAGSDLPVGQFPGSVSTATAGVLTRSRGTTVRQLAVTAEVATTLPGSHCATATSYREAHYRRFNPMLGGEGMKQADARGVASGWPPSAPRRGRPPRPCVRNHLPQGGIGPGNGGSDPRGHAGTGTRWPPVSAVERMPKAIW
jgi:hypothetical protein